MKLAKKIIAIALCLSFFAAIPFTPVAKAYSVNNGEFVFSNADMLSYLNSPYSLDVSYASGENALKLVVNATNNASDPQVLLNLSSLGLKASNYKSLVVIYRVPTSASAVANKTELFISAGSVTGPTGGKSVTYNVTKGDTYTSQIIDLSTLNWWSGSIYSIRIDAFNTANVGDTMYIDSIMLCASYDEAITKRDNRLAERNNVSAPNYAGSDLVCTKYENAKYTSPFWKGNIVYNEAVYPIKDKNGNTTYTLMYTPDQITSVYSSDFSSKYYEGIDYTVNGNKITFLKTGSMSFKDYYYIHPQSNPYGYSGDRYYKRTAAGDGKWEYWGQSAEFFNGYINVSYTHSDTWDHYVPQQKSSQIPRTAAKIKNGGAMNVVFFGDSICGGANSSAYRDVYPYAEYWNEMIVTKLRNDYGCTINAQYSAEGGGAAPNLVSKTDEWVTAYNPDLVFIEFGVNDAMNWSQNSSGSASGLKSEFKTAIINIIKEVRNDLPNCEFVLVAPFYSNIYCHYMSYFEACRDALNEIASSYSGVCVADVTAMHESLLEIKDYLDFSGDNMCHPNDYMARIYSQVCLEAIVPGGISAYTVDSSDIPEVEPDTGNTTMASPGGYGWQWPSLEAYGLINNYGGNGQDIIFEVDLSLISSAAEEAEALFYVAEGQSIKITPSSVCIGDRTYAYDWGVADISNWKTITIKIKNGAASIHIDGVLVGSASSGYVAHTSYQLFFSYQGCMAIDNLKLTSSTGKVYVDCDFEDSAEAQSIMGGGYGNHTLLAANTVSYDTNGGNGEISSQIKVKGTPLALTQTIPVRSGYTFLGWSDSKSATSAKYKSGDSYTLDKSVTLYAVWSTGSSAEPVYPTITRITPSSTRITDRGTGVYKIYAEGDGLKYEWICSDARLTPYLEGANTSVLTVNVTDLLEENINATIYCKVTNSDGNTTVSSTVSVSYVLTPAPVIESVTPEFATITDTGSATFSATVSGSGLSYSWTCSEQSLLPYISGADTDVLKVNVTKMLEENKNAVFTLTVTDKNGRSVSREAAVLEYKLTPAPVIESITPEFATITDTGSVTFSATVSGSGLSYSWTCSEQSLLPYVSGTNTSTLTVKITEILDADITAVFSLAVTDKNGRTVTSEAAVLEYKLTPAPAPEPEPEPEPELITGDVNGDGYVTSMDLNVLKRIVGGSYNATEAQLTAADVDKDGSISAFDSNILARFIAGVIKEL